MAFLLYTSNRIEDVVGDPGGAGNVGCTTSRADEGHGTGAWAE